MIPYVYVSPMVSGEWTLTPEDLQAAEMEAIEMSYREKAESLRLEREKLTETWGQIAKQRGLTMHDLFPAVFPE